MVRSTTLLLHLPPSPPPSSAPSASSSKLPCLRAPPSSVMIRALRPRAFVSPSPPPLWHPRLQHLQEQRLPWQPHLFRPLHCIHQICRSEFVASCPFLPHPSLVDDPRPRVLVISGPTAVGKSVVALELAKRLGGEIISADSVQVYEGLDVGSAKIPVKDRQAIPHHLMDIVHPLGEFCAGDYFIRSREATELVLANRNVPIVVGGTGMYLRWYLYGKPGGPKSTPESKALVDEELTELLKSGGSWDDAMQLLYQAGDTTANSTIHRNDWYRLRRSFEIIKANGLPRSAYGSSYHSKKQGEPQFPFVANDFPPSRHEHATALELDYHFMCFFLCNPRIILYRCIDQRCEEMLTGTMGLLVEASWLLDLGILPNTSPVSRAIGYRQAMEYLLECRDAGGSSSQERFFSFLSEFQKASRNYAKRQLTWFRHDPLYHWIDASQPLGDVVEFLVNAYKEPATITAAPGRDLVWKETSHKEKKLLKAYRTQNRHFVKPEDCNPVLEWIKKTQSCKR